MLPSATSTLPRKSTRLRTQNRTDGYSWEEFHTGTLYLSAFSGPVEGILLICAIYIITAIHPAGPQFWDTPIVNLVPGDYGLQFAYAFDKVLNGMGFRWKLEHLGINVAFMMFGGLGTIGNIVNR